MNSKKTSQPAPQSLKTEKAPRSSSRTKTQRASPVFLDEIAELDLKIAEMEGRLRGSRTKIKYLFIVTLGSSFISALISFTPHLPDTFHLFSLILTLYLLLGGSVVYFLAQSIISARQTEIDVLKTRRQIASRFVGISDKTSQQATVSYFDELVRINVSNLENYYGLVKSHTNNSFIAAIAGGCIGFTLIMGGLIVGFVNPSGAQTISFIASGAGIITEFISAVFFYLYNRTVLQMKQYHDSLLVVQNILLSFKFISDMSAETDRVKMVGQLLTYLIGSQNNLPSHNKVASIPGAKNHQPKGTSLDEKVSDISA